MRYANPQNIVRTAHDFGHLDRRWRTIGSIVETWEAEPLDADPQGRAFFFCPQATRNGTRYGPIQPIQQFATEADRAQAIATYLRGAEKRAVKIGCSA